MSIPINRRTLLATAAATVLATAIVPLAAVRADSLARVDVYDRSAGEALPVYRHHGRRYVEGHPGNEYAVRIRNCTDQRLLAVLSVDGVNAVTGETASPDQSGYVIEPGGYVTVQGWRKDLNRTAAFYFSDPEASYAARTGRPNDLGVIGVALFRERPIERQGWFSSDRRRPLPRLRARRRKPMQLGKRSTAAPQVPMPLHRRCRSRRSARDTDAASTRPCSRSNSSVPARGPTNWSRFVTSAAKPWSRWASCRGAPCLAQIPIRSRAR